MDPDELEAKADGEELSSTELGGWSSKAAPAYEMKLDSAKEGDVEVAFARLNVRDKDGHVTLPGAMPKKSVPLSSYGHTSWPERGARLPVGRADLVEAGDLAKAAGRFFLDTTHGRDTYLTVKALDELQEWSYGYKIENARKGKDENGKAAVLLAKLDVREVSPTLVGAGVGTHTIGIKSDDGGSLAGLSFVDHVERVLLDVGELVTRSKSLTDLRLKEGRELSSANRERLSRLRDGIRALSELGPEVEELLARTDPERAKDAPEVLRLLVEHERTKARLLGVSVSVGG